MLRKQYGEIRLILASYDWQGDRQRDLALVHEIIPSASPRWTLTWGLARMCDIIKPQSGNTWWITPLKNVMPEVDLVLSIGGDNYCYTEPAFYYAMNTMVHRRGKPLVLWGASVDGKLITPAMRSDLQAFALITARESETLANLAAHGITANVRHVADPAFTMEVEPIDTMPFLPHGETVLGFNISPLLRRYREQGEETEFMSDTVSFLRYVIDTLQMGVLLIPHVTQPMPSGEAWNDDAAFMRSLLPMVQRPERITLMPSCYNAAQTKYIIKQCGVFIGARTHCTIGALSLGIPTLSIGYSIKARGINLDLFGHTRYLLDIAQLSEHTLIDGLHTLLEEAGTIRAHLKSVLPDVRARAYRAVEYLVEGRLL